MEPLVGGLTSHWCPEKLDHPINIVHSDVRFTTVNDDALEVVKPVTSQTILAWLVAFYSHILESDPQNALWRHRLRWDQ